MSAYDEAMKMLDKQVGNKDGLISLSTIGLESGADGTSCPAARIVDAYYEDGSFYIVTHENTAKMRQIAQNPNAAVCVIVENFTADGIGENLGWVCDEKNAELIAKLRKIFAEWYYEANNEEDKGTCILRIRLTKGLWNDPHKGLHKEIDFGGKTVK